MIFPIRPTTTETRRVDDVNVRATPAVTGITAANGFNQPGVVVTIGDGARTLARSGQQPEAETGSKAQDPRVASQAREWSQTSTPAQNRAALLGRGLSQVRVTTGTEDDVQTESVFETSESEAGVEGVFSHEQDAAAASRVPQEDSERLGAAEDETFESVWGSEGQNDEVNASGVPYAALQRAASVQDLDVADVAKALTHTAVRVLATQGKPALPEVAEEADADEAQATDDAAEQGRLSNLPTDGVPYEALQRAVTEAENAQDSAITHGAETAQNVDADESLGSPTEPIFLAPENGGAPWGREVPFEDEAKRSVASDRQSPRKERAPEVQPQA